MSFTFATLKTAIQDYTDNAESTFVTNLPNFIKAAEDRILEAIDLEYFRKNVTSAMTPSDQFLTVPDDLLAVFSLQITTSGSENFLLQKDVNFLREYTPNASTTGVPRYYAVFSVDHFLLAPTPNSAYTVELHYFYRPTSLVDSGSSTTWISDNAPNVLLYGSLLEAYIFMKGEPDIIALYEKRFMDGLSRLKDLGEARENTDAYRIGLPSRPRT
tara:strand:- start:231 stop:875 length:645 start_codon:yes stop_codon:yes gene_type:complete